jgi:hypothetical protein
MLEMSRAKVKLQKPKIAAKRRKSHKTGVPFLRLLRLFAAHKIWPFRPALVRRHFLVAAQ